MQPSLAPAPFLPRQVHAIGPRWLLLSSCPNEEFHAFLADLLDQQRPLCPPPLLSGPPVRFHPLHGGDDASRRNRFAGSFDNDALIDFLSAPSSQNNEEQREMSE